MIHFVCDISHEFYLYANNCLWSGSIRPRKCFLIIIRFLFKLCLERNNDFILAFRNATLCLSLIALIPYGLLFCCLWIYVLYYDMVWHRPSQVTFILRRKREKRERQSNLQLYNWNLIVTSPFFHNFWEWSNRVTYRTFQNHSFHHHHSRPHYFWPNDNVFYVPNFVLNLIKNFL